ncbi:RidA family protein [Kribbella sp. NBC_01484]|uniref:RidA family protein n=1 Tax=Kribbella sp. NBC_01484 TaxID=2903579 RepID=UPI002E335434|nr:RidA family protein [Kribbella sp. NBC_01484]
MNRPQDHLARAGLELPPHPPGPAGAYRSATLDRGLLFTSGQVPLADGQLLAQGKVGQEVEPGVAALCAQAAALNALAAAAEVIDLAEARGCVSLRVFVAGTPAFTDYVSVADGASRVIAAAFPDAGLPVRTAVGVVSLPLDAPVEVELILTLDDAR